MVKTDLEELRKDLLMWESLKENDDKVLFYTGLPKFSILKMVFELALKVLPSIDNFTEFLLPW